MDSREPAALRDYLTVAQRKAVAGGGGSHVGGDSAEQHSKESEAQEDGGPRSRAGRHGERGKEQHRGPKVQNHHQWLELGLHGHRAKRDLYHQQADQRDGSTPVEHG